jgi:tetratricopeptide (TPR) repeat protein
MCPQSTCSFVVSFEETSNCISICLANLPKFVVAIFMNALRSFDARNVPDRAGLPSRGRCLKPSGADRPRDHLTVWGQRERRASLNNLAKLYRAKGRYAEAESLFQGALAIREKAFGSQHPDLATSLNDLAELYGTLGHYFRAEPLYQRVLAILEKALGARVPRRGHRPQ